MDRRDVESRPRLHQDHAGCDHCYAETFAERFRGVPGHPYEQGFDLKLIPEKLAEPLRWKTPKMIFVNSMSDLFHKDVPDELRRGRRPRHGKSELAHVSGADQTIVATARHAQDGLQFAAGLPPHLVGRERRGPSSRAGSDQAFAAGPGRCPVPLHRAVARRPRRGRPRRNPLGIVGGESGPVPGRCRRNGCSRSAISASEPEIPFFFKQWGGVRKSKAGRELDGRTYDERPLVEPLPVAEPCRRLAMLAEVERLYRPVETASGPSHLPE